MALLPATFPTSLPQQSAKFRESSKELARADTVACTHGTLVARILTARRASAAPSICPGCPLLLHPIFAEAVNSNGHMPRATPEELAGSDHRQRRGRSK